MKKIIEDIYIRLLEAYGQQGWWPIESLSENKIGRVSFDCHGYHHADYAFPKTIKQKFEIAIGAVLTQNTAWENVQKAMYNLVCQKMLAPGSFIDSRKDKIAGLIRPSGYFNMKALKLKCLDQAWQKGKWHLSKHRPAREDLLSVWGIGDETADSIMLYAFHEPLFVVDTYTKRIFYRLGIIDEKMKYEEVQDFFHKNLPCEERIFNEYHALIVRHAKEHCRKNPLCDGCPIISLCTTGRAF